MELVIGGQPHLRCTDCTFVFNFPGKSTKIAMSIMTLVQNAHRESPQGQVAL